MAQKLMDRPFRDLRASLAERSPTLHPCQSSDAMSVPMGGPRQNGKNRDQTCQNWSRPVTFQETDKFTEPRVLERAKILEHPRTYTIT